NGWRLTRSTDAGKSISGAGPRSVGRAWHRRPGGWHDRAFGVGNPVKSSGGRSFRLHKAHVTLNGPAQPGQVVPAGNLHGAQARRVIVAELHVEKLKAPPAQPIHEMYKSDLGSVA